MGHSSAHRVTVRGARVLDDRGRFSAPIDVAWSDGRFIEVTDGDAVGSTADTVIDGTGRWLIPGLVDAHTHASWHAFHAVDRAAIPAHEAEELTREALRTMLLRGTTSIRDAGGLTAAEVARIGADADGIPLPRVRTSVLMINREVSDASGGVERAVEAALADGAEWIKLVGTAGVASPPGSRLEPVFAAAETAAAVRVATQGGARVMVHAWGGPVIDYSIEAGAASIEHGIFLTEAQAVRAAERGLTFVPTLRIYRQVRKMIEQGELPEAFSARVAEAVTAHPGALRIARDAGLPIALGSDSGTPAQHRGALREYAALIDAGLTPAEALVAATRVGAELLAGSSPSASHLPSGRIAPGEIADAVLLNIDPLDPEHHSAIGDPAAVEAVILGGKVVLPRATVAPTRSRRSRSAE